MSFLTSSGIRVSEYGIHVPSGLASPRYPLVGILGPIAWCFDGATLTLVKLTNQRLGMLREAA